ncbi:MAG: undecaprenyl diphosphate synthase family protein, partial [Rhodospirillales bacterium]|nr:undecaprenyl diphosphate synthase family protein [Rhodospirillales bacterium]
MSSRPQPVATAEAPRAAEEPRTATEGGVPTHVAIIMDGNGRWAASRRRARIAGHREGSRALRRTIEAAIRNRVAWLTIYAFS